MRRGGAVRRKGNEMGTDRVNDMRWQATSHVFGICLCFCFWMWNWGGGGHVNDWHSGLRSDNYVYLKGSSQARQGELCCRNITITINDISYSTTLQDWWAFASSAFLSLSSQRSLSSSI